MKKFTDFHSSVLAGTSADASQQGHTPAGGYRVKSYVGGGESPLFHRIL